MRGCAGMCGDYRIGKVRLDFWARRSYLKCMTRFPAVPMQRRRAPAEAFELGSARTSTDPSARASAGPSGSVWPRSPRSQTQRRPRALRFADISAAHRCRYTNPEPATSALSMVAPLTVDAFALASALATQRFGERSHGGRPSRRPCGRPSGRFADSTEDGFLACHRPLRALRFADIPPSRKGRCASPGCRNHSHWSVWLDAPFAPDAIAIASALATQRFSGPPRWRCAGPKGIA